MLPGDPPDTSTNKAAPAPSSVTMSPPSAAERPPLLRRRTTPNSTLSASPGTQDSRDQGGQPPPKGRMVSHHDGASLMTGPEKSRPEYPFRLSMPYITPGQLAFSALQFLPVPVLVLNQFKTVVLANEAIGKLLGIVPESSDGAPPDDTAAILERLRGQSLSQVGIDMIQDGRPVWVTWENFFDSLADDMGTSHVRPNSFADDKQGSSSTRAEGDMTPTADLLGEHDPLPFSRQPGQSQQAVVEVVVSRKDLNKTNFDSRFKRKVSEFAASAKMIITIWEIEEDQTYFTLTFTNSGETSTAPLPTKKKAVARPGVLEAAERKTISAVSNPPSVSSSHESSSSPSYHVSPSSVSLSSSPFPPMGPPSRMSMAGTPSILQKMLIMKDTLLDNTQMPIFAMWKDGSVCYPNSAARRLFRPEATFDKPAEGFDLLEKWTVYTEDFKRALDPSEYPISVLLRTQTPFTGMRVGMMGQNGKKIVFDMLGEAIRDDDTGEFLAGVVTCRDVTKITREMDQFKEREEEKFKLICDTMPQLVWTSMPDGTVDFFNDRWYGYTGLSKEESLGSKWVVAIHPDDIPETKKRWQKSLATGEPYDIEYRCRSRDGGWRWFLGRALPCRSSDTGKVVKWFGTCTDVNESIETKLAARRTRQQLLSVIAHAHVTIFTVDADRKITFLEGALIWDMTGDPNNQDLGSKWYIGGNVDEVFNRLNPKLPEGERPDFLSAVDTILARQATDVVSEHDIDGRSYRTRFLPIMGKKTKASGIGESDIEGVIGMIMDVTELKHKDADLEKQALEKRQLVANEAAAKEASRLKSQFLANMSHEIRTPITGVIGMTELLLDVELDEETRELAENIYRSANALLTVINDILDFSKVESGRLDIEEVQFSMSVIVKDVSKMLSFAAQRRNLEFRSDIAPDVANDLVVLGDPGRVRQIITNLLTNSIKFTHQGFVKLSVMKEKETQETIEIKFVVEDTGIGIEEDVRKRLFRPFSQGDASTARKFGGTGLGLTICKSLLELMHGKMTLDSTIGQGTTATFWVPFNKPQGSQPAALVKIESVPDRLQSEMSVSCNSSELDQLAGTTPPPPAEQLGSPLEKTRSPRRQRLGSMGELSTAERSKIHVLVVEDNAINQQIATRTIKKLGFNVTASWNGKEALDYLASAQLGQNAKPDIILMDVQMPVIDGYKCTHLLRHHLPYKTYVQNVPIVAMTASAIQGDQEKCRRAGMDDYLAKPVKSKMLEKMLVRWSTTKRRSPTPQPASDASDCSDSGEHCNNLSIPAIGVEDMTGPMDDELVGPDVMDESRNSLPTPRPLTRSGTQEGPSFPLYQDAMPSPKPDLQHVRRLDTEEFAMASRDDKLRDAAGGAVVTPSHETLGDSLTEANVEKHDRAENLRRRLSID